MQSEDSAESTTDENIKKIVKTTLTQEQRVLMMYEQMSDKEYFTEVDWIKFMTSSPNNYDEDKIRNNCYHDINRLFSERKLKEIKTEDDRNYYPKRFKVLKIENQAAEEKVGDLHIWG